MDAPASIIAALEEQLTRAIAACDGAACEALLGEDFTAILPGDGKALVVNLRADWLRSIVGARTRSSTVDDTAVSMHGDVAIATVLWTENGDSLPTQFVVTDVWTRHDGGWTLLERHAGRPLPLKDPSSQAV
jgi:ketosteroid isomerase-like protein